MLFDEFENAIMKAILKDKTEQNTILLQQYAVAEVVSREFTGHGFFTDYSVPSITCVLPNSENIELGCLGELEGVRNGVGFILFIREGVIQTLEGYTYEEEWPEKIGQYQLLN